MPQVDGFLNICKPLGWTSHDVVGFVRRRIGQQRVGHAGTLDPAATGVLPLCLGRATRLADRVAAGSKLYAADVRFGAEHRYLRCRGAACPAPVTRRTVTDPPLDVIVSTLTRAAGQISSRCHQATPALKVDGEAAYTRARRGETVVLAAGRDHLWDRRAGMACSTVFAHRALLEGTYVRALARDLGTSAGPRGPPRRACAAAVGSFIAARRHYSGEFGGAHGAGDAGLTSWSPQTARCWICPPPCWRRIRRDISHLVGPGLPVVGGAPRDARAYDLAGQVLGLLRPASRRRALAAHTIVCL